ncbi:MAG: DciA family protein [Armatimonadota bacterium]
MRRGRQAAHIARALDELLEASDLTARAREQLCGLVWAEAVGQAVARVTRVRRVRDGVGYVQCESPVWAQQLSLQQRRILQKLEALLGGPYVKKLRFSTAGPREERAEPEPEPSAPVPTPRQVAAVPLTDAEVERIRQVAASAPAGELRERLEAALLTRERERRWKLSHGYRECRLCGNPFSGSGRMCYACRWEGRWTNTGEGD